MNNEIGLQENKLLKQFCTEKIMRRTPKEIIIGSFGKGVLQYGYLTFLLEVVFFKCLYLLLQYIDLCIQQHILLTVLFHLLPHIVSLLCHFGQFSPHDSQFPVRLLQIILKAVSTLIFLQHLKIFFPGDWSRGLSNSN